MLCFTQHRLADEFGLIQQAQAHAGIPAFWWAPAEAAASGGQVARVNDAGHRQPEGPHGQPLPTLPGGLE